MNSFREKVEKNMEATESGKYMIKASTILDITLQDYHKSRQQYGNEFGRENEKSGDFHNSNNMNSMNMNMGMNNEMNNNNNLNMDANNIMEVKEIKNGKNLIKKRKFIKSKNS